MIFFTTIFPSKSGFEEWPSYESLKDSKMSYIGEVEESSIASYVNKASKKIKPKGQNNLFLHCPENDMTYISFLYDLDDISSTLTHSLKVGLGSKDGAKVKISRKRKK